MLLKKWLPYLVILLLPFIIFSAVLTNKKTTFIAPNTPTINNKMVTHTISFFALGDQGTGTYRQKMVSHKMEQVCENTKNISFSLLLGDNFYSKEIGSLTDKRWQSQFESMYSGSCLSGMPFYAVLGNHDHNLNTLINYQSQHMNSARWHMPAKLYSFDVGELANGAPMARIAVLDYALPIEQQIHFLNDAFKTLDSSSWRLIASHYPIRSDSSKHRNNQRLIDELLPHLKKLHIDAYISGHAHNLQLIKKDNEPLYIISGAGGKKPRPLQSNITDNDLLYGNSSLGFAQIDLTQNDLSVTFYPVSIKDYFYFKKTEPYKFTLSKVL